MANDANANNKQWWAPVWRGLVYDPNGKHYRTMRSAIWLFLYLVVHADRRSGFLVRKIRTIASDMAVPRDAVLRWLNVLRRGGYIRTENTGRCLTIQITRWKPLPGVAKRQPQKSHLSNTKGRINPTSRHGPEDANPVHLAAESAVPAIPNDKRRKENIILNDKSASLACGSTTAAFNGTEPATREDLLAMDLAQALSDPNGIALYRSYARRYPEALLRRVLSEVRQLPDAQIRQSRAALFNHLVQLYAKPTHHDPGR